MTDQKQQLLEEIRALIAKRLTLELATVSASGIPCASYAPFVCSEGLSFWVFLSDLAQHTTNVRHNSSVSVMLIEDETSSPNLFARERLIAECRITRHDRGSSEYEQWIKKYKARFGSIVDTLAQLADFNLYNLTATDATYIKGFGQAYRISGTEMDTIEHIRNPAATIKDNSSLGGQSRDR